MTPTMTSECTAQSSVEARASVEAPGDLELLAEFLRGSESAFEQLVRRHAAMVYSAAVRQVFDPATAAEVTNAVFMVLARKARSFGPGSILAAWLHQTTRFAALKAIRARARRQYYEQEA